MRSSPHPRSVACFNETRNSLLTLLPNSHFSLQRELLYKIDILSAILTPTARAASLDGGKKGVSSSVSLLRFAIANLETIEVVGFTLWAWGVGVSVRIIGVFCGVIVWNWELVRSLWRSEAKPAEARSVEARSVEARSAAAKAERKRVERRVERVAEKAAAKPAGKGGKKEAKKAGKKAATPEAKPIEVKKPIEAKPAEEKKPVVEEKKPAVEEKKPAGVKPVVEEKKPIEVKPAEVKPAVEVKKEEVKKEEVKVVQEAKEKKERVGRKEKPAETPALPPLSVVETSSDTPVETPVIETPVETSVAKAPADKAVETPTPAAEQPVAVPTASEPNPPVQASTQPSSQSPTQPSTQPSSQSSTQSSSQSPTQPPTHPEQPINTPSQTPEAAKLQEPARPRRKERRWKSEIGLPSKPCEKPKPDAPASPQPSGPAFASYHVRAPRGTDP